MLSDTNKIVTLYKDKMGVGNTRDTREFFEEALKSSLSINPTQIWKYGNEIPDSDEYVEALDKIRALDPDTGIDTFSFQKDESTIVPLIKFHKDIILSKIDNGTDNAFVFKIDNKIVKNVIPFNYFKDVYNYTLKTPSGEQIPFGVGDWVFDPMSSILTFNGVVPNGIDHDNPPLFSCYQYIGGNGFRQDNSGYEGVLVPLRRIGLNKGTFIFKEDIDGNTIQSLIINEADKISPDFVLSYGWDGADENAGIASFLEVLSPLLYSSTKDPVKGQNESKDSAIYSLISKSHVSEIDTDAYCPDIKFISDKTSIGEHKINISVESGGEVAYLSFDDGNRIKFIPETLLRLDNKDETAFIVIETGIGFFIENSNEKDYKFTVEFDEERNNNGTTTVGLFYWSKKYGKMWPYILDNDNYFDIGFPVVSPLGTIPPSVKFESSTIDSFEDSITPDYYGPRIFNIIVAKDGSQSVKSADYVVRDTDGYYLHDIINEIKNDFSKNYKGTIYFRNGIYKILGLNGQSDLSYNDTLFNNDIIYRGEDYNTVIFSSSSISTVIFKPSNLLSFQNITFDESIVLEIYASGPVFLNSIKAKNIKIHREEGIPLIITNCDINELNIDGDCESTYTISECNIGNIYVNSANGFIKDSIINILNVNKSCYVSGNTIGLASFNSECNVSGNIISSLIEKLESSIFEGNYVKNFNDNITDIKGVSTEKTIPYYNKERKLKYVSLSDPFTYNEETNSFDLLIDPTTLQINQKGELEVVIDVKSIHIDDVSSLIKDSAYSSIESEFSDEEKQDREKLLGLENNSSILSNILEYIFKYKADLVKGKVPLSQLPDSVAYGGLSYCGMWSIEQTGKYPQFEDIVTEALKASYDKDVNELQPGWFCIIDNSLVEENNPTKEQFLSKSVLSGDHWTSGISSKYPDVDNELTVAFTAGDWIIFEGYVIENGTKVLDESGNPIPIWSKIDRSYQNPIFTRLPSKDLNNKDWKWDDETNNNPGTGELDLNDKTIYEAFHLTNEQLNKLKVKHPPLISEFKFVEETEYEKQEFYTLNNDIHSFNKLEQYIDGNKYDSINFISSNGEDWRSYIYYGNKANFKGFIATDSNLLEIPSEKGQDYIGNEIISDNNDMTLLNSVDPFINEMSGSGYWRGTKVRLTIKNPTSAIYSLYARENDINPLLQNIGNVTTPITTVNVAKDFEIKAELSQNDLITFNYDEIKTYYMKYNCGFPYLSLSATNIENKTLHYKVSFTIRKCFFRHVNKEILNYKFTGSDWLSFQDFYDNSESYVIQQNKDDKNYFDLIVTELCIPVNKNLCGLQSFRLDIRTFGFSNEEYKDLKIFEKLDLISDFNCSNRVCSGTYELDAIENTYPDFSTSTSVVGFAGSRFNNNTFINEQNIELMAYSYINENDEIETSYKWPSGSYYDVVNNKLFISYENSKEDNSGQDILINNEKKYYKYVTIDCGEIEESNGFMLKYEGQNIKIDSLTGSNKDMSIQIYIEGDNVWYNANSPIGYYQEPSKQNDPCMYAGKSSAYEKRISFGQRIISGNVFVRIGIEKDSDITICNIRIEDIV